MILKLELNIRPVPHQSVRFTRSGRTFKPKKITDYQAYVCKLVEEQLPEGFGKIPAGVPIFIRQLSYQYEWSSATPKKRRVGKVYKATKPDLQDNLNKAFLDALEGLVYEQDQNIVSIEKLEKYYGEKDKIILILEYDA
jgi:Holliday junction resolvase RusA-like endonuclease